MSGIKLPGRATLYEVDFRNLTPASIANGTNTIDGKTWRRVGNNWTTCETNATQGLRMLNSNANGPLFLRLSEINPYIGDLRRIRAYIHWDHAALGGNWEYLVMGIAPMPDAGGGNGMSLVHGNLDGEKWMLQINSSAVATSTAGFSDRLTLIDYDPMFLHVAVATMMNNSDFFSPSLYTWQFRSQQTVQDFWTLSLFFISNNRDWHIKKLRIEGLV